MKNDRIDYLMDITFENPKTSETYDTQVYIPTEIFCNAIRDYVNGYFMVNIDGTDSDIINLFGDIEGGLDRFGYNEDFLDICRELYKESTYYDDDLEEVIEENEEI